MASSSVLDPHLSEEHWSRGDTFHKSAGCTNCTEDALQKLRGYFAKKLLIFLGGWWQGTYKYITVGFKWFSDVQPCCQGFLLTFDYPPIAVCIIWSEGSFVNRFSCWLKSTFKENDHNGVSIRSKLGRKRFRFEPT